MPDFDVIRSNVQKMVAQNAPETDIDAYLQAEGVNAAQLRDSSDPYKTAARKDLDQEKALGLPSDPYQRRMIQGMTLNAADEIIAGLATPIEMIRRKTFNPAEGYRYAKAREDMILEDAREKSGVIGDVAEMAGGGFTGAGAAGAGISFARNLPATAPLLRRAAASAGDAAAFGAVAGAMDGNGVGERVTNAAQGGLLGGIVGGAFPFGAAALQTAAAPVTGYFRAITNPEGFARSQVARSALDSGRTSQELADAVTQASREGQSMFTLADAMGPAGQRKLAATVRTPGEAATDVVEFLDRRQAGQGRRIASQLAEGFESPQTAAQTQTRLTAQRSADADVNYGAAREMTGAVNVTPAIQEIDRTLAPGLTRVMQPGSNIADDSIDGVLRRARALLTDDRSQVSRFEEAFRVKQELDLMIDRAPPTLQRLIIPVRNRLDRQLELASEPYAAARNQFREQSRAIDAVDTGRDMATRGRTEDTIPAFQAMNPAEQASARVGYVDPLIANTQQAAYGANKARPLLNDAFADEAAVMAPGNAQMQRQLGREDTMFQTRNRVTGNSKTAENMNDDGALKVDASFVTNVLSGNVGGALRTLAGAAANGWNGNTAAVRDQVAQLLMQRGPNLNAQGLQRLLDEAMQRIDRLATMARLVGRGAAGGTAVAPSATGRGQ